MVKLKVENTEGVEIEVSVEATNPNIKTYQNGMSYRDGDIVELAKNGKLSEETLKASPALIGMSQAEAVEIVTARFTEWSENLQGVEETPIPVITKAAKPTADKAPKVAVKTTITVETPKAPEVPETPEEPTVPIEGTTGEAGEE